MVGNGVPSDAGVTDLLSLAVPKPAFLSSTDGGPALALAVHVLMVKSGFRVVDTPGAKRSSTYNPPAGWNTSYFDQWVYEYTYPGKANKFKLHCSLQAKTRRMFVHASELDHNVQILGLQLDNYFPDVTALKSNSWQGMLQSEAKLVDFVSQHITTPLLAQAEDVQVPLQVSRWPSLDSVLKPSGSGEGQLGGATLAVVAVLASVAVVGGVLLARSALSRGNLGGSSR